MLTLGNERGEWAWGEGRGYEQGEKEKVLYIDGLGMMRDMSSGMLKMLRWSYASWLCWYYSA